MKIELDTNNLSATDVAVLQLLVGGSQETTLKTVSAAAAPTPTPAPAKATPAPKKAAPAPTPEPVVEEAGAEAEAEAEDLVGGAPTMADAVSAATVLVSSGGAAKVKEALASVGAKRVSEMQESDIPAFLAALQA